MTDKLKVLLSFALAGEEVSFATAQCSPEQYAVLRRAHAKCMNVDDLTHEEDEAICAIDALLFPRESEYPGLLEELGLLGVEIDRTYDGSTPVDRVVFASWY